MTNIVIKDLPENLELDRQAMLSIVGGARSRGQTPVFRRAHVHSAVVAQSQALVQSGRQSPSERKRLYPGRKGSLTRQS